MIKLGVSDLLKYQNEIERKTNECDFSLRGNDGFCFIEGDLIVKVYNSPIIEQKMCDFSKYQSERIAFPFYYIKKGKRYYGEVMPYYPYQPIERSINENTDVNSLLVNYYQMVEELKKYPNIHMQDVDGYQNILYDEQKGIFFIDTLSWEDLEWTGQDKYNTKKLDKALFYVINNMVNSEDNDLVLLKELKEKYKMIRDTNLGKEFLAILESNLRYNYRFLDYLNCYREIIKKEFDYEVKTLEDVKKYTKIMKNS